MTRYHKALSVFLVTLFGLWGCARGPDSSTTAVNDRVKSLEAKTAKLEEDLRSTYVAKEQLRKDLTAAEEAQANMQREIDRLKLVSKERDELKVRLGARTLERDTLQAQYEGFRKNIKELLGQADAAANPSGPVPSGLAQSLPTGRSN